MFKAIGTFCKWIFGQLGNLPTAAAQKEKHETQIMLLNAQHEDAISKLQIENSDLRAKVEPLTQQLKQCQNEVSVLQEQIRQYEAMQDDSPPSTFGSVGL